MVCRRCHDENQRRPRFAVEIGQNRKVRGKWQESCSWSCCSRLLILSVLGRGSEQQSECWIQGQGWTRLSALPLQFGRHPQPSPIIVCDRFAAVLEFSKRQDNLVGSPKGWLRGAVRCHLLDWRLCVQQKRIRSVDRKEDSSSTGVSSHWSSFAS